MFRSAHPFGEADQCDRVPVSVVPVDSAHPAGLAWERPCKCPKWAEFQNQVILGARPDGSIETEKVVVSGCLFRLLPWVLGTAIRKSNETMLDVGKCREEVEHARQGLAHLAAVATLGSGSPLLVVNQRPELPPPAAAALPPAHDQDPGR